MAEGGYLLTEWVIKMTNSTHHVHSTSSYFQIMTIWSITWWFMKPDNLVWIPTRPLMRTKAQQMVHRARGWSRLKISVFQPLSSHSLEGYPVSSVGHKSLRNHTGQYSTKIHGSNYNFTTLVMLCFIENKMNSWAKGFYGFGEFGASVHVASLNLMIIAARSCSATITAPWREWTVKLLRFCGN